MKASEVQAAVFATGQSTWDVCEAITITLPVLRKLAEGQGFWLKWGMGVLIRALEDYQKKTCI